MIASRKSIVAIELLPAKSSVVKRIELQKKRAELENMQELAKARKMRMLAKAEADEAEDLAKVR